MKIRENWLDFKRCIYLMVIFIVKVKVEFVDLNGVILVSKLLICLEIVKVKF